MTSLEGRIALVTGAGAGIGRAVALELARAGATVAVHYHRSREGAEAVVAQVQAGGGKAIAIGGDLTKREDAERVVAQAAEALGPLDILVNNAGDMVERRPFMEMTEDLWRKVFDLNVTSTFFVRAGGRARDDRAQVGRDRQRVLAGRAQRRRPGRRLCGGQGRRPR